LANWERERRVSVTIDDIRRRVGSGPAKDVARFLVKKGVLRRVSRGIYIVQPLRSLLRPTTVSSAVTVAILLQARPYYLGGLWAFTFHRLTSQQYVSALDAFVARRMPNRRLGAARVTFHVVRPGRLKYGIANASIDGMSVNVSDPERTLLDALDYPRAVGNLRRGLTLFRDGLARVDPRTLIDHACHGSRLSTCQRVGVVLERAGTSARLLVPLQKRVARTRSLLSMLPDAPRLGRVNRKWNVVENDL
jgi:predicted transcriptional regulator of viral defense system